MPVDCPAVAPARADTRLHGCAVVGERLVLTLRRGGAPLLAITDLDGQNVIEVPPSFPAGSIAVVHAEDYDAGSVIVVEESLVEPPAWYRLDLATGRRDLLQAARGSRVRRRPLPDRAAAGDGPRRDGRSR